MAPTHSRHTPTTKAKHALNNQRTTIEFNDKVGELLDRIMDADQMPSRASTLRALVVREARRRGWETPPAVISMSGKPEGGSDANKSDL